MARAVKAISLAEEHLHDHFPGRPVMPNSLIIEGMGQTGMLLACEAIQYAQMVLLAKISRAAFYFSAVPGDKLIYTATISGISDGGVVVGATSHRGDQLQGEAELLFTRLADKRSSAGSGKVRAMLKPLLVLRGF